MPDLSKFIKNRIGKEGIDVTVEILDKILMMIGAGMTLVVALAWNTAIRALFDKVFSQPTANVIAQFVYAVFLTIVVVIALFYLGRIFRVAKNLQEESHAQKE